MARHGNASRRVVLGGLLAAPGIALAQPAAPIRLIVPYPPGGTTDVLGRMMAEGMAPRLGRTIVVDNRSGASGIIGTEAVLRAPADGATLAFVSSTHAMVKELFPNAPFDPTEDVTPIIGVASTPYVLVAHPGLNVTTLPALVALARSRQGGLTYASTGIGTSQHLLGEVLRRVTGTDLVHVPYRGSGPVMADLLAGRVPMMFENVALMAPLVRRGDLRGIAVTSASRSPALPEVPTMAELGMPEATTEGWFGLLGPRGLPTTIVATLNATANEVLRTQAVIERVAGLGGRILGGSPEDLDRLMRSERARWGAVIREAGVRPE